MMIHRIAGCCIVALMSCAYPRALAETPAFSLADLAWMQGHWITRGDDGLAEEIWMAPLDGSMVGSFRWAVPGRMHVLEFLIIEQRNDEVTFRFKHFDRDYRAWEESPNAYRLVRVEGNSARFENVAWNGRVPQVIHYLSLASDRLTFRGESPDADGEPLVLEFRRAD